VYKFVVVIGNFSKIMKCCNFIEKLKMGLKIGNTIDLVVVVGTVDDGVDWSGNN
jgi:hypothetical protein